MLGEVPSGWVGARASDVFSLAYGKSLPADARTGDGFPVLGSAGKVGLHRDPLVRGPGVVVGRKGTAGAVHWVEGDFTPIDTTYFVERRTDVDWRWLYFVLTAANLPALCETTGVPGLNRERVAAMQMLVPPLPEQKKIAAILSSVDEAIQATQAVIDQTRRVKEGLLQDLLTRGIGHTRFKQTEIGEIPEGWEVRPLEEVCGRVGVGIASSATHAYRDAGVPLIRNQNIKYGYLDLSDLLYVEEAYDLENQTKRIHTGDVLTIRTGYPGVSAVVPPELNNAQSFTTLVSTPKPGIIRSQFLAAWINGPVGRRLVLAGEAGGAQHNLNAGELKRLPVPVPPLGEQDGIMSVLQSVSAAEGKEQETVSRLAKAKSGLLTDLLTGKVRVTP